MLRVAVKNLLGHKLRTVFTAIAIALGVAFMAGSFVLTDTVSSSFDTIFTEANAGIDAQVRGEAAFEASTFDGGPQRPDIDPALAEQIRTIEGVADAEPVVASIGTVLDDEGGPLNSTGPSFGANWTGNPKIDVFTVVDGREPAGATEAVVDKKTADAGGYEVGDTLPVQTLKGKVDLDLVGIVSFGDSGNLGGASFVMMETDAALATFTPNGQVQQIAVIAEPGVSEEQLVADLTSELPDGLEAITATQATEEALDQIGEFFDLFQIFLTAFAVIALMAGAFLIYNTYGIIIGQRLRETALLRALGASRNQVLSSVIVEAAVTGLVASILGLIGGVGLAILLQAMLSSIGFGSSDVAPVVAPRTIVVSLLVGVVVSVLCAVAPAWRSSRVPPIAALRETAAETAPRGRGRLVVGLVLVTLGVVLWVLGAGGTETQNLVQAAIGTVAVFAGVVVLGPHLVPRLTGLLGAPLAALGVSGALGRDNARRNPKRSAGTASALMLAVTLICFIAVFTQTFDRSINAAVDEQFTGDLEVIGAGFGFPSLGPDLVTGLAARDEVGAVTGVQRGNIEIDGSTRAVYGVRFSDVQEIFDIGEVEGDLASLGPDQIALDRETAELALWGIGTPLEVTFPNGETSTLTVGAIYENGSIIAQAPDGHYLVSDQVFQEKVPGIGQLVQRVDVRAADGVSVEQLRTVVEEEAEAFPSAKVRDVEEIKAENSRQLQTSLLIFFALLGLALVIGALGVAITLALSVFERTREVGLLRAVGTTRSQLIASITTESILLTLLGTVLGLVIGVSGGAAVAFTQREGFDTFRLAVSPMFLIAVVVLAVVIGVGASVIPGFRAARLNVLDAVTHD